MKFYLFSLFLLMTSIFSLSAQIEFLQSGPMLGYAEMREVLIWAQTNAPADVHIEYWAKNSPNKRYKTEIIKTEKDYGFVAKMLADSVLPDSAYTYDLFINGNKIEFDYPLEFQALENWEWRKDPPSIKIALGSCSFINDPMHDRPGKGYGGELEIFEAIHKKDPDLMLWLGDNVYYRESDWNTKTGMIYRNTYDRSIEELQPLLASTHHYAIWDDHDYGPNNSDRSFANKHTALEVFEMFWANPTYGFYNEKCAVTKFNWGDVDFFMLDNRWFRTPNFRITGKKEMLGEQQIEWLIDNLVSSRARFKIIAVGGQVINPLAEHENYATFPEERRYLLDRIRQENIKGVLFLSGDRHYSVLSSMKRYDTYPLIDFTVSPLNSGTWNEAADEANTMKVEGTTVAGKRNFGMIEISGTRKDRKIIFSTYDSKGELLWKKEYKDTDFR